MLTIVSMGGVAGQVRNVIYPTVLQREGGNMSNLISVSWTSDVLDLSLRNTDLNILESLIL